MTERAEPHAQRAYERARDRGTLVTLIVLVLIFYAGPQIFSPATNTKSFLEVLSIA